MEGQARGRGTLAAAAFVQGPTGMAVDQLVGPLKAGPAGLMSTSPALAGCSGIVGAKERWVKVPFLHS